LAFVSISAAQGASAASAVVPPSIGIAQKNLNGGDETLALTLTGIVAGGGGLYTGSVSGFTNQLQCTPAPGFPCMGFITMRAPNPRQFSSQCFMTDYTEASPIPSLGIFLYQPSPDVSMTLACNRVSINGGSPTNLLLHVVTLEQAPSPELGVYYS
jgi:hypothetical protein